LTPDGHNIGVLVGRPAPIIMSVPKSSISEINEHVSGAQRRHREAWPARSKVPRGPSRLDAAAGRRSARPAVIHRPPKAAARPAPFASSSCIPAIRTQTLIRTRSRNKCGLKAALWRSQPRAACLAREADFQDRSSPFPAILLL